ncbi:hypothetical protein EDD18DRAFT_869420 [Armillaria luteobubalina]|uniref:Uncharacterized protein n=1 Tax=Armillaria luteobubalina TaxID=153913 RepID=A0AA39P7I3_9AGAR|nr:hypothetical protein EDD18DRAFT_869420 [Armillaria luteobubalina]
MSYYFIHGTEESTNRIGGYQAPNPFHATYPFDASIAHYVEDAYLQESHEATATMPSSQSESDASSVSAQSQSDQSLDVQMAETADAQESSPLEETLSDSESDMEEIQPSEYSMTLATHSLVKKCNRHRPCIQTPFEPPSDNPSEVKICSPPPDRKQISEGLGRVKYKLRSPGLSPYSQDLIEFKDPSAPFGTFLITSLT